ncbi:hypothetical protein MJH12_04015 [bacterium]|nr:hypothetical protein [bacterium]
MITHLNHVAILVQNIDPIVQSKLFLPDEIGDIDTFESEGTKEVYIGKENQTAKLLLMEAISEGPYLQALKKRGPGLHHIAIDVLNTKEFVSQLAGSGWYLHPSSLELYDSMNQVFLTRPGIATLIEVNQVKKFVPSNKFIQEFHFPFLSQNLINGLACKSILEGQEIKFHLANRVLSLQQILGEI